MTVVREQWFSDRGLSDRGVERGRLGSVSRPSPCCIRLASNAVADADGERSVGMWDEGIWRTRWVVCTCCHLGISFSLVCFHNMSRMPSSNAIAVSAIASVDERKKT
ncbi:hypothetical protein LI328DRAFT_160041 [Trichoderma asperelloides]|nr:hypothetical protein LI328DRAFT_160041 [Trichoderma asperelloides]